MNFVHSFPAEAAITTENKLKCLIAYVSKDVYDYVSKYFTYPEAIQTMERLDIKPCNIIFARHLLITYKYQGRWPLDDLFAETKATCKKL